MWDKRLTSFWAIGIFAVLPLAMTTKGYSNITVTKVTVFGIIAITAFFWMVLLRYFDSIECGNAPWIHPGKAKCFDIIDILLIIFFIANVITCISSGRVLNDLSAAGDKHMGMAYVILLFMLYLSIKYTKIADYRYICIVMTIGTVLAIMAAILQFMGVDFFNFLGRLSKLEVANFLSTMGNTAVFGKYICIVCPAVIYYLGAYKDKLSVVCFYLLSLLFPCGVIVSNTDAGIIGLGIAVILSFILALYYERMLTFVRSLIAGLAGVLIFGIVYHSVPTARHVAGFVRYFVGAKVMFLAAILLAIFIVIMLFYKKLNWSVSRKTGKRIGFAVFVVCVVFICAIVGAFVYFSFINTAVPLGRLETYLRFGEKWGTGRGTIWRWCMNMFSDYSFKDKLFGAGHGMVPQLLKDAYWNDMKTQMGYYFDNAHNFFLHQLLTIGIVGVVSYIALLIALIVKAIRNAHTAGFAMAIIIYLIVGMVCICEPISEPYIWVFYALISKGEPDIADFHSS